MVTISKTGGPGLRFENEVVRSMNARSDTMKKGFVVEFHAGNVAGGFTRPANIDELAWWAVTYTDLASAPGDAVPSRLLGVALEDAESGQSLRILVRGVVDARMLVASAPMAAGTLCRVAYEAGANGNITEFPTNPGSSGTYYLRACALTLEATAASGDFSKVLFDGINGFACTAMSVEE